MLVILYRKRLVSALVKAPVSNSIVMSVIPLRVRQREPLSEPGHLAIDTRTHAKVPVIGHDAKTKQIKLVPSDRFGQDAFKSFVVLVLEKQLVAAVSAVKHVINATGFVSTLRSAHFFRSQRYGVSKLMIPKESVLARNSLVGAAWSEAELM